MLIKVLMTFSPAMATPVTTGTAVLVRQYFVEGWYPLGSKGTGPSLVPSASLIKAVLLNGAQSILGIQQDLTNVTTVSDYDNNQNFGRINLLNSLTLDGENDFATEVHDRVPIVNGDEHEYVYQIGECESNTELSATLVWTDPYAASGCLKCLINDVDLTVEKQDSAVVYANGRDSFDRSNNSERVRMQAAPGDTFTVRVYGSNLATSFQNYALVVTGCFGMLSNAAVNLTLTKEYFEFEICVVFNNLALFSFGTGENYPTRSPTKSSSPTVSSMPTTSVAPSADCTDVPGWVDSPDGNDCSYYEDTDLPGCPNKGTAFSSADGILARDACCYCRSSEPSESPSLSVMPSISIVPTRICEDLPEDWLDSTFEIATCELFEIYEPFGCGTFPGYLEDENGNTAKDACCWCGGGDNPIEGLNECEDTPGWFDSYDDGCSWYRLNDPFCVTADCCDAGLGTAAENCCICGGGSTFIQPSNAPSRSQEPSVIPTTSILPTSSFAPNYCANEVDWYDSFGDNCTWYEDHEFACGYGDCCDAGVGIGTPNMACCVCGGGQRASKSVNNTASNGPSASSYSPSASPSTEPTSTDKPTSSPSVGASVDPTKAPIVSTVSPTLVTMTSAPVVAVMTDAPTVSASPSTEPTTSTSTAKPTVDSSEGVTNAPAEAAPASNSPVVASSSAAMSIARLSNFAIAGRIVATVFVFVYI